MKSVFELARIDENRLALSNKATGAIWLINYRKPTLFAKSKSAAGNFVIESDWSGPAEELFAQLVPLLQEIRDLLTPHEESFESYHASSDYSHDGTTYCDEYQRSVYTCRFSREDGQDSTASFSFKNWELDGVSSKDMGEDELETLKWDVRKNLWGRV